MNPTLACIVEGHGEVAALPILLRRLAYEAGIYELNIPTPIRCPRSKYLRKAGGRLCLEERELVRLIQLAVNKLPSAEAGAILILLDADEACPAEVGPQILQLAHAVRPTIRFAVVLPKREYEAWLLAALRSLAGKRNVVDAPQVPERPEEIPDAKGYLTRQLRGDHRYSETVDQPALSSLFSFAQAEACDSFRKLRKEFGSLLFHLFPGSQAAEAE